MNPINVFDTSGAAPVVHDARAMVAPMGASLSRMAPPPMGAPQPGSQVFVLRRSGSRPLSFAGRHLGAANGYRVGTSLWHEINLYQTDDGRFVGDVRIFHKAEGSKDQFVVEVADSLEDVLGFFEGYDAKGDVSADFELDDPALSPAELMVHAASLKYRLHEAVSQYRSVLANFLKDLHQG